MVDSELLECYDSLSETNVFVRKQKRIAFWGLQRAGQDSLWIAVLLAADFKNCDVSREPKPANSLTGEQKHNTYAFLLRWRSKRKEVKSSPLASKPHKS